jgi:hypothetical protein
VKPCTRLVAVAFLAVAARPAAAQPGDLAELFPPGTLAYVELIDPAEFAPQVAALVKGTAFEDSILLVHARKDAAKTLPELRGKRDLAGLGLLLSPEMLAEAKRLRVAAGLVGFSAGGDPDFVVVVLTGDSPAAGLAARAYLTMTPTLRRVGEVAGVPVFQHRTPNVNLDNDGVPTVQADKPPEPGPHEPTYAYTPGLFVFGSSQTAVGHALRRFRGDEKDGKGGLAATAAFKWAAAAHRHSGVFYFVNFADFVGKFDAANRASGNPREPQDLLARGLVRTDLFAWFKVTANTKAVKVVAGNLRFRDGGGSLTATANFDPAHKSPLMDFLSGPGAKADLLHHARKPAGFAFAISFPEKDRAVAVVGFLDALAKADGELGRLPGDLIRELEQKHKLSVANGLVGKTRAATVFLPLEQELPKGAKPTPVLVLHADEAEAAAGWEQFLPKLFAELAGGKDAPQPSAETVGGVKVFSLPAAGLPWNAPVHFARKGNAVAVGLDRKVVAAAVTAGPADAVTGGDKGVSLPAEPAAVVGLVSLGQVVARLTDRPPAEGPVVPVEDDIPNLPNGNPVPEALIEAAKKGRRDFVTALGGLAPATVSVRRTGNELRLDVFQPGLQNGGLKAVLDAAANWLDARGALAGTRNNGLSDPLDRWGR